MRKRSEDMVEVNMFTAFFFSIRGISVPVSVMLPFRFLLSFLYFSLSLLLCALVCIQSSSSSPPHPHHHSFGFHSSRLLFSAVLAIIITNAAITTTVTTTILPFLSKPLPHSLATVSRFFCSCPLSFTIKLFRFQFTTI